jgi:hypothetical protein
LVVSGTAGCRVFIDNCFFYATPSRCIYVTNTGAGSALRIWDSTLNAEASTGVCIEYDAASTVGTEIRNSSFFGSTAGAVLDSSVASTSFIADSVDISTSGILCVTLTSSVARITNCLISASGVDATGILLASASQMSLVQTGFNVAAGTGYCVQGAAGNVNAYAQVSFAPATNVRFQNTVTNVALTTTPTLAP